ncbi:hypothetical protein LTR08_001200 [Meristemomyces frigidus]|nr:hypothetical protein LTR08_001200 [Meristemomyces frigidus]
MSSISAGLTPAADDQQHIRLACQTCQRKKIKCRGFPCGQCNRSSLHCIPSIRKSRTRHAGKRAIDGELRSRITKLESLVESLSGEVGLRDDAHAGEGEASTTLAAEAAEDTSSPSVGKYIGSSFWSSLTTEVQALRDALEEDQEDQHEDDAEQSPPLLSDGATGLNAKNYDLTICPPGAIYVMPGALEEPAPATQALLHKMFILNVAPMFIIFHVPTLRAFLERRAPYLGQEATALPNRAVKASLWFAAVNTISDADCQSLLGHTRSDLMQRYRRTIDVLLAQADLMNTTDLATLQAFVTTLVRNGNYSLVGV